jgi:WhiB family redox-sensing transcriptional regulator
MFPAWMSRAACAGGESETFFPECSEPAVAARTICAACDVRAECLEFSLRERIEHGVWGGLSSKERKELRRKKRVA